jgi:hypothetical protein
MDFIGRDIFQHLRGLKVASSDYVENAESVAYNTFAKRFGQNRVRSLVICAW